MHRSTPPLCRFAGSILLFQALTWTALSDTILLKNGDKLEGKILKTTETSVEVEVKLSAAISDVRVVSKDEIASIAKPDPAEEAFANVAVVGPGPNSRTVAEYDTAMYSVLSPFISTYAASPRAAEAKAIIESLKEEKARVAAGERKIDNIWYTPVELEKQKDQVNATLLFQQMKALAKSGDTAGALNVFNNLEKTYPGSRAYPSAVDYALQLLPGVQADINNKRAILANDVMERKKGLEVLPDFRKAPLIAAAEAEEAQANAALDASIKAGIKWTQIYPRNQRSIDELQKTVTSEAVRLTAIKTAPMFASIAAVDEARKLMASGDVDGATADLTKASTFWTANALLKDAMTDLAQAKITPTPTPTPPPPLNATPKPPTTSTTLPAEPMAGSSPATPVSPAPADAMATAPKPKTASPVPTEKPNFFATIPGAITILIVVGVIAGGLSLSAKSKSKKNASADS